MLMCGSDNRRMRILVVEDEPKLGRLLVRGLGEARRRGMSTIAICGYDGGRLAREQIADHCFVVRSSSIHRIQEVQMTLYHLLTELVHRALEGEPACA